MRHLLCWVAVGSLVERGVVSTGYPNAPATHLQDSRRRADVFPVNCGTLCASASRPAPTFADIELALDSNERLPLSGGFGVPLASQGAQRF